MSTTTRTAPSWNGTPTANEPRAGRPQDLFANTFSANSPGALRLSTNLEVRTDGINFCGPGKNGTCPPERLNALSSETKHAFKTTEFWAMTAIVAGILVASWVVGQGDGNGNANVDAFPASRAWLYVAIVGVGYMVSRGLAKAGSRDPYWADENDLPGQNSDR